MPTTLLNASSGLHFSYTLGDPMEPDVSPIPGSNLAVVWKQQPVIRVHFVRQPFVCCLLFILPLSCLYKRSFLSLDI